MVVRDGAAVEDGAAPALRVEAGRDHLTGTGWYAPAAQVLEAEGGIRCHESAGTSGTRVARPERAATIALAHILDLETVQRVTEDPAVEQDIRPASEFHETDGDGGVPAAGEGRGRRRGARPPPTAAWSTRSRGDWRRKSWRRA